MVAIKEEVVIEIATQLGFTPAQVVLRWGVQRGYAVIPKSANEGRIKDNWSVEGVKLRIWKK